MYVLDMARICSIDFFTQQIGFLFLLFEKYKNKQNLPQQQDYK